MDAIGTRQVDHMISGLLVSKAPRFLFYGYPRIIADFLPQSGQSVKYRRFSNVWVAHQGNLDFRHAFTNDSIKIRSASDFRSAMALGLSSMRKYTGPLNGSCCFLVNVTPGRRPIS